MKLIIETGQTYYVSLYQCQTSAPKDLVSQLCATCEMISYPHHAAIDVGFCCKYYASRSFELVWLMNQSS